MLRVTGIKLSLDEGQDVIPSRIARKLRINIQDILQWRIYKESIDARKRQMIYFVYTVDVSLKDESYVISKANSAEVSYAPDMIYEYVVPGKKCLKERPVIVGTGPAGLFAGLLLARMGYQPLLLERGDDVETRSEKIRSFWERGELDTQSNVQFGEGGAGTFSDGKLTTLIKDKRCRRVLEDMVQAGAPPDILYSYKPHIGTDILQKVVINLRQMIKDAGGEVLFRSQVTGLDIQNGSIKGVEVNGFQRISCQALILAIGHSARDTMEHLYEKGIELVPKAFSIGVRIEHPQDLINKAQYKDFAGHPRLGAADYKLAYHSSTGRSAYTFCMCPGGMVVAAASEAGHLVTNGMSYHSRGGENANSALLVGVVPEDFNSSHPLAGIEFQRKWEKAAFLLGGGSYRAPVQRVVDFLTDRYGASLGNVQPTYPRGVISANLTQCLPSFVVDTLREALVDFNRKIRGFTRDDALITGVETRSSSPIRIIRQDDYEASISGVFPAGEGAGYAGGIISAAVDGLRVAEALVLQYKPLTKANYNDYQ